MVALQILVLSVWVRILVGQQKAKIPYSFKLWGISILQKCTFFCEALDSSGREYFYFKIEYLLYRDYIICLWCFYFYFCDVEVSDYLIKQIEL